MYSQKRISQKGKGVLLLLASLFFSITSNAQCAMCRAALESQGDTNKAEAVNDGIVYLMVIPYLLVAVIGYAIYRTRKGKKQQV
jgi:hypothetical protein